MADSLKKDPFKTLFGTNPRAKVILLFLSQPGESFSKSSLSRLTNISRQHISEHCDSLVSVGVLHKKGIKYGFRSYHVVGRALIKLYKSLKNMEEKKV